MPRHRTPRAGRRVGNRVAAATILSSAALDAALIRAYVADVLEMTDLSALISVVIIDVVLAGDNAIVVGMAAAGLPARQRHRVILAGIAAATVLRILFAGAAMHLLEIIGLMFAGGILLLWVAWKMYREIRAGNMCPARISRY